jgi:hypothetical protein
MIAEEDSDLMESIAAMSVRWGEAIAGKSRDTEDFCWSLECLWDAGMPVFTVKHTGHLHWPVSREFDDFSDALKFLLASMTEGVAAEGWSAGLTSEETEDTGEHQKNSHQWA